MRDHKDIPKHIAAGKRAGLDLKPSDFVIIDGEPTIDGMPPREWIDAMSMD